ncbi:MAG: guanine deaminase [Betaproteobacteria bacterium]|nr:guanine deaminase [Betaproteobacteria bacterium]
MTDPRRFALRGAALSFDDDPFAVPAAAALRHETDAAVVIRDGCIEAFGPAARLLPTLPDDLPVTRYDNALILPGFIDAHVHYAQLPIVAAFGKSLLDWLEHYTFVVEQRFADPAFAAATAEAFLDECLRQGVTTAAVYGTVHPQSVTAFFAAAQGRGLRMIAGKVWMDRNAPPALQDTAQSAYDDSKALIERWHGRGRLAYAVTPRFAATSSPEQLAAAGALLAAHPDVYLQTHLAETQDELAWVRRLYPEAVDYLDVYARHGLVGRRSVFGHGIHLPEDGWQRLHDAGAAVAHCPTSNNFLGSGHFRMADAKRAGRAVRVALATDVGGGTTLSMFATMNEAYKVARHAGFALSPAQAFWLVTRGAAQALDLDGRIGALAPGNDADLVVLDLAATPLLSWRIPFCESIEDVLAVLMMLGDDRLVAATYAGGRLVHRR